MKTTKKLALYAIVPVLGLTLAVGASAMGNKAKGERAHFMGQNFGMVEMGDQKAHLGTIVDAVLAQVKTQIASGKSIDDIINGKTIDLVALSTDLKTKFEADMNAKIAADLKSGKITQAQVDKMKGRMEKEHTERLKKMSTQNSAPAPVANPTPAPTQ